MAVDEDSLTALESRILIGIIADEETTIGFLLAGIGESHDPNRKNFMIVTEDTPIYEIVSFFNRLYNMKNIGVILIGADIYKRIGHDIKHANQMLPIILKIPSKNTIEEDYNPS